MKSPPWPSNGLSSATGSSRGYVQSLFVLSPEREGILTFVTRDLGGVASAPGAPGPAHSTLFPGRLR